SVTRSGTETRGRRLLDPDADVTLLERGIAHLRREPDRYERLEPDRRRGHRRAPGRILSLAGADEVKSSGQDPHIPSTHRRKRPDELRPLAPKYATRTHPKSAANPLHPNCSSSILGLMT